MKILKIETIELEHDEQVYDLSVKSNNHNFKLANGVFVHNSMRVPKQFFAQTDDAAGFNGGSSLSIISSRYGKAIKRIQNTLCQALEDLINIYLLDKGLTNYINRFKIRMQAPLTQEEIDRRENMRNRVGVITDIMNQVSNVIDDNITKAKILKVLLADSITDPEVITLIQEEIDSLENPPEEKEDEVESTEDHRPTPMGEPSGGGEEGLFGENPTFGGEEPTETPTETGEETIEPVEGGEESYLPTPDELGKDMTNNGEF